MVNKMFFRLFFLIFSLFLTACNSDGNNAYDDNPYEGFTSTLYSDPQNWLCMPDIQGEENVCESDLSSTIVFADGTTQFEESPIAIDQPIDCFYVYPTVSDDIGDNADLVADAEIGVTFIQAARYRSVCRLFVPLYRQKTISSIFTGRYNLPELNEIAYGDVLDAFKHFVANNDGRGFILVGHSQGTEHLIHLIQDQVENDAYLKQRMIAAHLIGFRVAVPNEAETGATFLTTLPCSPENFTRCYVNYSSYRASAPPNAITANFGITDSLDTRSPCTHPVDLGAGLLELDSYFSPSQLVAYNNLADNEAITTPFIKLPGLFSGECIEEDGKGYLAITVNADPDDPRVDDVSDFLPGWGLHRFDVALPHGNLISLADKQAADWLSE
jgi:hypothetical protein